MEQPGGALAELNRYDEAIASYDSALGYQPNDPLYKEFRQIILPEMGEKYRGVMELGLHAIFVRGRSLTCPSQGIK